MTNSLSAQFHAAYQASELTVAELWQRYFALGGDASELEVDAYLNGAMALPAIQHDMLALAINERLDEIAPPAAPYSGAFMPLDFIEQYLGDDSRTPRHPEEMEMAPDPGRILAARMAEMAKATATPRAPEEILAEVTAAAVELIPGVDTAGILVIRRNGFESLAGTTDVPHRLDELQMTFNEGPCVQAAIADSVIRTADFRRESRWPRYSPAVVKMGVLSGISFKLFTADRTAGALDLF
jgi:hypothetical protein